MLSCVIILGHLFLLSLVRTSLVASGPFESSVILMALLICTKLVQWPKDFISDQVFDYIQTFSHVVKLVTICTVLSLVVGRYVNWMSKMLFFVGFFRKMSIWLNLLPLLILLVLIMYVIFTSPYMFLKRFCALGFTRLVSFSYPLGSLRVLLIHLFLFFSVSTTLFICFFMWMRLWSLVALQLYLLSLSLFLASSLTSRILVPPGYFLGLQVTRDSTGLHVHQLKYVDDLLTKFDIYGFV